MKNIIAFIGLNLLAALAFANPTPPACPAASQLVSHLVSSAKHEPENNTWFTASPTFDPYWISGTVVIIADIQKKIPDAKTAIQQANQILTTAHLSSDPLVQHVGGDLIACIYNADYNHFVLVSNKPAFSPQLKSLIEAKSFSRQSLAG
ncbi:MAG: hypothetical protein K0S08_61 [Gammaproteobacteria bacterium]|jgi:hypothetical protein|nr:hypothetical protein [Gammaproteobacteria bacterium]